MNNIVDLWKQINSLAQDIMVATVDSTKEEDKTHYQAAHSVWEKVVRILSEDEE